MKTAKNSNQPTGTTAAATKSFEFLCDRIFASLKQHEHLTLSVAGESSQFIRFNRSLVRQTGLVEDGSLSIELIYQNRRSQTNCPFTCNGERDLGIAVKELERLRAEIVQLPEDPYVVLHKTGDNSREVHTGSLLPEEDALDALLPAMKDVDLAGYFSSGSMYRGNNSSLGHKHWYSLDNFVFDYSLISANERMVKAYYADTHWEQSEYEGQLKRSRAQMKQLERPTKTIKPGTYRTYFAPTAVANLAHLLNWEGLSEAALRQGPHPLADMRRKGKKLSPLFNLLEDFAGGMVPKFNTYGELAPEYLPLITGGALQNTLISARTAKEYGLNSNRAGQSESMRAPLIAGGDLEEDAILKAIGTGLYISNLHYLNWSDRVGGRITGITRYACFWVENGEIVAPIENMRFDDTIHNLFGSELEALTRKVDLIPETSTYIRRQLGVMRVPGVLVKGFQLTL